MNKASNHIPILEKTGFVTYTCYRCVPKDFLEGLHYRILPGILAFVTFRLIVAVTVEKANLGEVLLFGWGGSRGYGG